MKPIVESYKTRLTLENGEPIYKFRVRVGGQIVRTAIWYESEAQRIADQEYTVRGIEREHAASIKACRCLLEAALEGTIEADKDRERKLARLARRRV